MTSMELKNKKIIIATHVYTTGPAQDLKEYLLSEGIGKLMFIGHPLFFDRKLKGSGYELYEDGKQRVEKYGAIKKRPMLFAYFRDVLLTVLWAWKSDKDWDLFVGSDNLNAFSGILLKKLGRVKKVVYYVIDYDPHRFQNRILNKIYHYIDQFCVLHADETWNVSPRMEPARKEYFQFDGGRQKVVPVGIWFERIQRENFNAVNKNELVFMGHILEKQGVQYVLEAIPVIKKEIPKFTFLVIGGGEYLDVLKMKTEELGISSSVKFTGYVEQHSDIERMLGKSALAVALYEKCDGIGNISFSYFADPAKLKSYLACGLPVLISDVPHNAQEISNQKCGFLVGYESNEIATAIVKIMRDENILKEYRENAIVYAKKFDWENIFESNLKRLL